MLTAAYICVCLIIFATGAIIGLAVVGIKQAYQEVISSQQHVLHTVRRSIN